MRVVLGLLKRRIFFQMIQAEFVSCLMRKTGGYLLVIDASYLFVDLAR